MIKKINFHVFVKSKLTSECVSHSLNSDSVKNAWLHLNIWYVSETENQCSQRLYNRQACNRYDYKQSSYI